MNKKIDNNLKVKVKTAKGRKISSTRWLSRQLNDTYVKSSKVDGYRSRASYKLIEMNEVFGIFKKGQKILDLGSAPGSWTQVAMELTKGTGKIISVDLKEMDDIPGCDFYQMDFLEEESRLKLIESAKGKFDVILSDMAPSTIGHKQTDHLRIMNLCEECFYFSQEMLKDGGSFVVKIFQGGALDELLVNFKKNFKTVKHFKPKASRDDSSEMYIVSIGFNQERG